MRAHLARLAEVAFVTSSTRGQTQRRRSLEPSSPDVRVRAEETALSLSDPVAHAVAGSLPPSPIELAGPTLGAAAPPITSARIVRQTRARASRRFDDH